MPVVEASDGATARPGVVYIAPGGSHLLVSPAATLALSDDAPELSCRPAVDVLFRSAARAFAAGTLGIVLTGIGEDGLLGSRAIVAAGGRVIAQDPTTALASGMPGRVVAAGLASAVLPLGELASEVLVRVGRAGQNVTVPGGTPVVRVTHR
jgi:two-component system chemotaxis response regulator CheB